MKVHSVSFLFLPLLLFSVVLFSVPAEASVRITEFLYDAEGTDEGREYVELINTGPQQVSVESLTFIEHGREHALVPYRGSSILSAGDTALILSDPERFLALHPTVSGTLLSTSHFSLNNSGSALALHQGTLALHSISYTREDGAHGTGMSLHVSEHNTLSVGPPSPGIVSGISVRSETGVQRRSTPPLLPVKQEIVIRTVPRQHFAASTIAFTALRGESVLYGAWNFGDGTRLYGETIEHAYLYPGRYLVTFTEKEGDETAHSTVSVILPQVRLERLDPTFVRFLHTHAETLDVSGWSITDGKTHFTFPKGSFVLPEESTVVPFSGSSAPVTIVTAGGGQFAVEMVRREEETPAPAERVVEEKPVESTVSNADLTIVWISILFGLFLLLAIPFFFVRKAGYKRRGKK